MGSGEKMKLQVEPERYYNIRYDKKSRFCSYWHQIQEILLLRPKEVLEIGIGNGFVSEYLKKRGIKLITLDIDRRLNPDIVGSVLELPFADESFSVLACYELLEHIPYEDFNKALSEILRVCKSYAILSLPDVNRVCRFYLEIPKIMHIKKLIPFLRLRKHIYNFDGQHYWEIGKSGYPLRKIVNDIKLAGFKIEKTYRVFERPYHRFFLLKKSKYHVHSKIRQN